MERAPLERYVSEGLSLEQMGGRLGKHPTTVAYWLKKHGLTAVNHDRYAPKGGIAQDTLEELIAEGLTLREMAARLDFGFTAVRYWLKAYGLETERMTSRRLAVTERPKYLERRCKHHGVTKFVRAGTGKTHYRCMKCRAERVSAHRRKVKRMLVQDAGGRCQLCGYDRFPGALEFHHVNPSQKRFGLAAGGVARSLAALREEASKCALLCSNCHAEVENGVADLPNNGGLFGAGATSIRSRVA
jgi:DNA-directed RNA polymerase subunit RPC12/RpoP